MLKDRDIVLLGLIVAVLLLVLYITHGASMNVGQQHNVISDYFEYSNIEEFNFTLVEDNSTILTFLRPTKLVNGFNNERIYRPVAIGYGFIHTNISKKDGLRAFAYRNDGIKITLQFEDNGDKFAYAFNEGKLYEYGSTKHIVYTMNAKDYIYDYSNLLIAYFKTHPHADSIIVRKCNSSSYDNDPNVECASTTSAFTLSRAGALASTPVFDGYNISHSYKDGGKFVKITENGVISYEMMNGVRINEYRINFLTGEYGVGDRSIDVDFTPINKTNTIDLYSPINRLEYYRLGAN